MKECCGQVLERSVVERRCRVLEKSVVEKCWRRVLWKSVGEKCCTRVLYREVLFRSVGKVL